MKSSWRDEVLAAIILPPMVVAMIVWQLGKRSLAVLKGPFWTEAKLLNN